MTSSEAREARNRAAQMLTLAGITLTPNERANVEIADFGLGQLETFGLQLVTYINNDRYCAKELVLFPRQTCPEHRHPPVREDPGKEETFRYRWGKVWLYLEGTPAHHIHADIPEQAKDYFTVFSEVE